MNTIAAIYELICQAAACLAMIVLLLFLQKQNLANAIYLFGLGTLLFK
jgi:hypothetical protein